MPAPSTLQDLLARVEAATGADRNIDRDLFWTLERARAERTFHQAALGLPKPIPAHFGWHDLPGGLGRTNVALSAPEYSRSLDAALALVERVLPEWVIRADIHPDATVMSVEPPFKPGVWMAAPSHQAERPTPALALLAALLKALIAQEAGQ